MKLIVYGDFNCPYSCLASARCDELQERKLTQVEWRAVEHDDPSITAPSEPVESDLAVMLDREVAEVRGLLRPAEVFPIARPPVRPNTAAAIAAFAAASATDADGLRRRLFAALWFEGRDTGDPNVVEALGGQHGGLTSRVAAEWRDAWLGLEGPMVPMLVLPDGYVSHGLGALHRLADLGARDGTND